MQLFRAQLSRYIPHPHRDSWMRNHLDAWLQLLRIGSFLTLLAAAWNVYRTSSPLGTPSQFQAILEQATGSFFQENDNSRFTLGELQHYVRCFLAAFFAIAALTSFRCGKHKKAKYILPVFISGIVMIVAAAHQCARSDYEVISVIPYLLPIATPLLLLSYRRLANKVDHWNYYANFLCVTTIFGNALTFLFYTDKFPQFGEKVLSSMGLSASGELAMTIFSYIAISFALLTAFSITRRLGLFVLITIGILSSIYRVLAQILNSNDDMSVDLIVTDFFFYTSYWLIPLLILLSLASRRKTQTLKL